MEIRITVESTDDPEHPVDIDCSVADRSGLDPKAAQLLARTVLKKVSDDNPVEG